LDCKGCHKENEKSIGPSFMQVAQKYVKDPNAVTYLSHKIISGGGGVWGETVMAAHPNLPEGDAQQIVQLVLSLSNQGAVKKSLPQSGTITPPANTKPGAALVLSASYTDKGGNNIKALTGRNIAVLNSSTVMFTGKEKADGFTPYSYNGSYIMVLPKAQGWFAVDSIDLTGVISVGMMLGWQAPPKYGYDFELRSDAPDGKVLGTGSLTPPADKKQQFGSVAIKMQPVTDGQYHTIYIVSKPKDPKETVTGGISLLQFNSK
jgi:cytochrome c551/c552